MTLSERGKLLGIWPESRQFYVLSKLLTSDPATAKGIIQENRVDFSLNKNTGMMVKDPMKLLPLVNELLPGRGRGRGELKGMSFFGSMTGMI